MLLLVDLFDQLFHLLPVLFLHGRAELSVNLLGAGACLRDLRPHLLDLTVLAVELLLDAARGAGFLVHGLLLLSDLLGQLVGTFLRLLEGLLGRLGLLLGLLQLLLRVGHALRRLLRRHVRHLDRVVRNPLRCVGWLHQLRRHAGHERGGYEDSREEPLRTLLPRGRRSAGPLRPLRTHRHRGRSGHGGGEPHVGGVHGAAGDKAGGLPCEDASGQQGVCKRRHRGPKETQGSSPWWQFASTA
mmetsp:Transcript_12671/g.35877  ORF Transcript_12671/g.35877 Transcript_12671/m.35877 type:complete len:243 (+) Transcript_12671:491-1219(+)